MAAGQGNLHCVHVCTNYFINVCVSPQTTIYWIKIVFFHANVKEIDRLALSVFIPHVFWCSPSAWYTDLMIYRIQPLCDFSSLQMLINGHIHLFHLQYRCDRCAQFIMLLLKFHISRALISPVECIDLVLESPDCYKISSDKQFPYSIYHADCEHIGQKYKISNFLYTLLKEDGISLKLNPKCIIV